MTDCDGKVGIVGISFKTMIENDDKEYNEAIERKNSMIERPVSELNECRGHCSIGYEEGLRVCKGNS